MSMNSLIESKQSQKLPKAANRRAGRRYPWRRFCNVKPEEAQGVGNWSGITSDLSNVGVGIALTYPVLPGTNLIIEPLGNYRLRCLHARVVRSVLRECVWFHGCEFAKPLTEDELTSWLRGDNR
jgi:hypothetical protein